MSKGNLFLGFGRGKVGDVVFSRVGGEQVARARNRSPKNPRTPLQLLQRVVLKTSSVAFSAMQDICNHSFQGREGVTANQSRFVERNVALFRNQLAEIINSGDPDEILQSSESNFNTKGDSLAAMNPYQVSEGTLPTIGMTWVDDTSDGYGCFAIFKGLAEDPTNWTYQDLISRLNCLQGDQLTLLNLFTDDTEDGAQSLFNGFQYSRFIIDPSDGDLSHKLTESAYLNPKNEGTFIWCPWGETQSHYALGAQCTMNNVSGLPRTLAASALILSREIGGTWARSTEFLAIRPDTTGGVDHLTWDHHEALLSDAIYSYMTDASSLLYLNQAENF